LYKASKSFDSEAFFSSICFFVQAFAMLNYLMVIQ
jgi:hypothetical protein